MIAIRRLIWDDWNVEHIARHQVTPAEVEATCKSDFILLSGKKGRLVIVGPTWKRRMLAVILDPEPEEGVYYPVTAYPASRKLRRVYQQRKKGGEAA
jgi:hypothetical protein